MDMWLSSRVIGYLAIVCVMVVSFFLLIEFFWTALFLTGGSVAAILALSWWRARWEEQH